MYISIDIECRSERRNEQCPEGVCCVKSSQYLDRPGPCRSCWSPLSYISGWARATTAVGTATTCHVTARARIYLRDQTGHKAGYIRGGGAGAARKGRHRRGGTVAPRSHLQQTLIANLCANVPQPGSTEVSVYR
ncbi:hypothetical protein J6590_063765 [Homalodisca vitripennis]|nr:hypothetical protein J6590_063765 [Homalodisca vitripennis]